MPNGVCLSLLSHGVSAWERADDRTVEKEVLQWLPLQLAKRETNATWIRLV